MKKIFITSLNLHYNKINNALIDLLNNIDLNKYSVDLLIMEPGELELDIDKKINILYYKDYMLMPSRILYNLKRKYLVNDLYNQFRFAFKNTYDIAIAYYGDDNYVDMIPASIKADKKIIWVHSIDKLNFSNKYNYFDNIVFTTKANMDMFNFKYPKYKEKTLYINNLIDIDKITRKAKEKTNIKLSNGYNIINISNLKKENNIDTIIDIHRKLLVKNKNIHTYIIGDGAYSYKIASKIRKYNIASSFILLGKLENPYNILKQASLYLDVSTTDKFNNSLLENMVLNRPCITTNSNEYNEIKEYISRNGIEYSEVANLVKTIEKQIKNNLNNIVFDYKKYNKENMRKLKELFEDKDND